MQDKNQQRLVRALDAINRLQNRIQYLEENTQQSPSGTAAAPIAIVGMGCRFPGGVNNPQDYWALLQQGRDAIDVVPADRWNAQEFHDSDSTQAGKIVTQYGGFLPDVDQFDAAFFGISPKEAATLDPQQRLLLEVAWEAMEDAGIDPQSLRNETVGVFVGISSNDYSQQLLSRPPEDQDAYVATGNAHSAAAGRLSYCFGFNGPSMIVDTACSSSLVAVHVACQSLRAGECDIAVVGGVNRILNPDGSLIFSRAQMLAPDGRCKVFDASADGFSRSEGCGVVVLKRLKDTQPTEDDVAAVIRGSAVNQDGRSSGLTVPNGPAQQTVVNNALQQAGLTPQDIDYIEAHGTGTALGDPIEVGALASVFFERDRPLLLGSVKANLGHMEAAAGIGGLIKTVLSMRHNSVPGQVHFHKPNPHIQWGCVEVVNKNTDWPRQANCFAFAGVSSFGFAGTNAHVVLQSASMAEVSQSQPQPQLEMEPEPESSKANDVLVMSAKDSAALDQLKHRYLEWFKNNASSSWQALCRASMVCRAHHSHRFALVADSLQSAQTLLQNQLDNEADSTVASGNAMTKAIPNAISNQQPKIAFFFTGQGSQLPGMGKALYESEPAFSAAMNRCDHVLQQLEGWSLLELLYEPSDSEDTKAKLNQTQYAQPALFAIAYALSELWKAWGVQPAAVLGHSIGEIAAAVSAGAMPFDAGLRIAAVRGRLMQQLPGNGAMAMVMASAQAVEALLNEPPHNSVEGRRELVVAADNGPDLCVVSGEAQALSRFLVLLKGRGVGSSALPVSHAFHSPMMAPMVEPFGQQIANETYHNTSIPVFSTLTGGLLSESGYSTFSTAYWADHIVQPVQYQKAAQGVIQAGYDVIIELGPQAPLLGLLKRMPGAESIVQVPSLLRGQPDSRVMANGVAKLYMAGVRLHRPEPGAGFANTVKLPLYPFQRQRHWYSRSSTMVTPQRSNNSNPFIGAAIDLPGSKERRYQANIDAKAMVWPDQHQVFGVTVLPAAGFLELGLQLAALGSQNPSTVKLSNIDFHQALALNEQRLVQSVLLPEEQGEHGFAVYSSDSSEEAGTAHNQSETPEWVHHASGSMDVGSVIATAVPDHLALNNFDQEGFRTIKPEQCYERLAKQGVEYGDLFHALRSVAVCCERNLVLSTIALPGELTVSQPFQLHPIILDACLQSIAALYIDDQEQTTYLPASVNGLWLNTQCSNVRETRCVLKATQGEHYLSVDLALYLNDDSLWAYLEGLQLRPAALANIQGKQRTALDTTNQWLSGIHWQRKPVRQPPEFPALNAVGSKVTDYLQAQMKQPVNDNYLKWLPKLDALASAYARRILCDLGVPAPGEADDGANNLLDITASSLNVVKEHRMLFSRLHTLANQAELETPETLEQQWQVLLHEFPNARAELTLLKRCAESMVDILQGRAQALDVLFPGGDSQLLTELYENSPGAVLMNNIAVQLVSQVLPDMPQGIRVLEVGAGTGGTTAHMLPVLSAPEHEYCFTDLSPSLLAMAQERFASARKVDFMPLDIGQAPTTQGFRAASKDLLIAANVLHATPNLNKSLQHCTQLLAPGGWLIMLEMTQPLAFLDMIFGLTEGWWNFEDTRKQNAHALITPDAWKALLLSEGFDQVEVIQLNHNDLPQSVIVARKCAPVLPSVIWFANQSDPLRVQVESADNACWFDSPLAIQHLELMGNEVAATQQWVYVADPNPNKAALELATLVKRIHDHQWPGNKRPQLIVVTRGAAGPMGTLHSDSSSTPLLQAALLGVVRVIRLEHPEIHCRYIDIDPSIDVDQQWKAIQEERMLHCDEEGVSLRGGQRYVSRLNSANTALVKNTAPFKLVQQHAGSLDGLALRDLTRRKPNAGEVELRVQAAGLNLIDVLDVLGALPFERGWLGVECAAEVVAVGAGVTDLKAGDQVMALAPGSFSQYVTVDSNWVVKRPENLSVQAAAAVPAAFLTAMETLVSVAQLKAGERVLIHAAAGGTGMASLIIAQQLGAEVFATASPHKWQTVSGFGANQVMNSRNLDFEKTVCDLGGVDVVLNSLSGEFIPASLNCLKPGGRFIEIGKRDIWSKQQMAQARPDVDYHCVDVMSLAQNNPPHIQRLLKSLYSEFAFGNLVSLPLNTYPVTEAANAFRTMQRAEHVGKLVLNIETPTASVKPNSTYLISGGLGGLGLKTAKWLLEKGAKHIVLLSRSEAAGERLATLNELKQQHPEARLIPLTVDVANKQQLAELFERFGAEYPVLHGVFHAAGQLQDCLVQRLDQDSLGAVFDPKLKGASNLHELSLSLQEPLGFFVLYSSAASLLGSPGQTAHVAANRYLDALAQYRRQQGLAGLSINWGPWSEIGAAANQSTLQQMAARGIDSISPNQGMAVFEELLDGCLESQVGVVPVRWEAVPQSVLDDPFFTHLRHSLNANNQANKLQANNNDDENDEALAQQWAKLTSLSEKQRRTTVVRLLQDQLARVLAMGEGQKPHPETGFFDLGLDSLMAVELRNRLAKQTGFTLSSASIFEYPNIRALADHLLENLIPKQTPAVQAEDNTNQEQNLLELEPSARAVETDAQIDAQISAQASAQPGVQTNAEIEAELAALDALLEKN